MRVPVTGGQLFQTIQLLNSSNICLTPQLLTSSTQQDSHSAQHSLLQQTAEARDVATAAGGSYEPQPSSFASIVCIHRLHPSSASIACIHRLHPSSAFIVCIHRLHPSSASIVCIYRLHAATLRAWYMRIACTLQVPCVHAVGTSSLRTIAARQHVGVGVDQARPPLALAHRGRRSSHA